jgi:tetratricopeptide (TPR) repeat protein
MKKIKIFLASSDELIDDRNVFGNLVRKLDKIYEKRGIRIELFEWEDYDAAYNNRRKQDEYNDHIKDSDMFLALFHTKAGKFTIEEFNIAIEDFRKYASPKVYIYCKELQTGEYESEELKEFKRKLFQELGHYWSRYTNRDTMQLHFVMQLQLVESSGMIGKLEIEDGTIVLEESPIAKMENLQFAVCNKAYQQISYELALLPKEIEKIHLTRENYPNEENFYDELQQKINRYNSLKDEFKRLQKNLLETALRINALQTNHVSVMLRYAIEEFEEGNVERANVLLDEIALEAEQHMLQFDKQRSLVHQDIEVFQLQAKIIMANTSIPLEERIKKVFGVYKKAENWAERSMLDKYKSESLLSDYSDFLIEFAFYDIAEVVCLRLLLIREELYGQEHLSTAASYHNTGELYRLKGEYSKSIDFHLKSLSIRKLIIGLKHIETAESYNNIGLIYLQQGKLTNAKDYLSQSLRIREEILDSEHPKIAESYNNFGVLYWKRLNYSQALIYFNKSLSINQKRLGMNNRETSVSFCCIGLILCEQKEYSKALDYYFKAQTILENVLGNQHPDTATCYIHIGYVYHNINDYSKALEYYNKALNIFKNVLGNQHPDIATLHLYISITYFMQCQYRKSAKYFLKALTIRLNIWIQNNWGQR